MAHKVIDVALIIVAGTAFLYDKPLHPKTSPGRDFVDSLTWSDATIESVDKSRVRVLLSGELKPVTVPRIGLLVIDESEVTNKPLRFVKRPVFINGEKVRISKWMKSTCLMIPAPEQNADAFAEETDVPEQEDDKDATRIPTADEVKDVLRLDTKKRRDEFAIMREEHRMMLLWFAGNVTGVKGLPSAIGKRINGPTSECRHVALIHSDLLDSEKVRKYLISEADKNGVSDFLYVSPAPKETIDDVKVEYAWLGPQRELAHEVARSIAIKGLEGISDFDKQFVRKHRVLFGID